MIYIKTQVNDKAAEHLYSWLKTQTDREIYVEEIIQCLENVFEDSDQCLKTQKQLKKLKISYFKNFNVFQSEFLQLINSAKMSADQWKKEVHNKLYDSLQVQMKIYVTDKNMSFNVYCKKTQQFVRDLIKTNKRIKK